MLRHLRPHRVARSVAEIDCGDLCAAGVRGVLLDLDNTLTPWRSTEISAEIDAWMRCLASHDLAACLVTNAMSARRVQPVAEYFGIPWVLRAAKPFQHGFVRGMSLLGTDVESTAIIGDQVFTDIWGGNRLGLYTILVDPMPYPEAWITRLLQRPLERVIGRTARIPPALGTGGPRITRR